MQYKGYFSARDGKEYMVLFERDMDGVTIPNSESLLTLGGNPFTTSMSSDGDTIYTPVKCQGASIEIITSGYKPYLYADWAGEVTATLYSKDDDGKYTNIEWKGFVTPNLYSQSYDKNRELITIECIDGLSLLQYIPYTFDGSMKKKTIWEILSDILTHTGYPNFCFPKELKSSSTSTVSLLKTLSLEEENFFDDKDANETWDDVAWKCSEVLEEICRYFGVTAVVDKNIVYFIDYDIIRNVTTPTYDMFVVGSPAFTAQATTAHKKTIQSSDISATGTKLSLDNVYNKVKVTADVNERDNELADITKDLVAYSNDSVNLYNSSTYPYTEGNTSFYGTWGGVHFMSDSKFKQYIFTKYYKHPNIECYLYDNYNTKSPMTTPSVIDYTTTKTYYGSVLTKHQNSNYVGDIYSDDNQAIVPLRSIAMKDYILCMCHQPVNTSPSYRIDYPSMSKNDCSDLKGEYCPIYVNIYQPAFTYKEKFIYPNSNGKYLTLNFNATYMDREKCMYIVDKSEKDETKKKLQFIWAKIKIGNYYVGGPYKQHSGNPYGVFGYSSSFNNVGDYADNYAYSLTTNSNAKVRIYFEDNDSYNSQSLKILGNISWSDGLSESDGIAINLDTGVSYTNGVPDRTIMTYGDDIEITVYKPHALNPSYRCDAVFISGWKVGIEASNLNNLAKDKDNTDTEYRLDLNVTNVESLDDVTYKIHTYDDKKLNKSSVLSKNGYFTNLYHAGLVNDTELQGVTIDKGSTFSTSKMLRPEWWFCYKIYKQYSTPSVILDMNLRNDIKPWTLITYNQIDSSKRFIVDSLSRDYRNNSCTVRLVEKK